MSANQQHPALADYLFPVSLADTLPLDPPEVEYIGVGDFVRYERTNERGEVTISALAKITSVNYFTQQVHLFVSGALRFWVSVESVNLIMSAATPADFAAFIAA